MINSDVKREDVFGTLVVGEMQPKNMKNKGESSMKIGKRLTAMIGAGVVSIVALSAGVLASGSSWMTDFEKAGYYYQNPSRFSIVNIDKDTGEPVVGRSYELVKTHSVRDGKYQLMSEPKVHDRGVTDEDGKVTLYADMSLGKLVGLYAIREVEGEGYVEGATRYVESEYVEGTWIYGYPDRYIKEEKKESSATQGTGEYVVEGLEIKNTFSSSDIIT